MPPLAIVPVYRITFPYVVDGFSHVFHKFLNVVASADPSGYSEVARAGHTAAGVSVCMQLTWGAVKSNWNTAYCTLGNAHLDHFVGGAWVPIWYEINAIVPPGAGASVHANLCTYSGYSTNHEKYKMYLLEGVLSGAARWTSYASAPAVCQNVILANFNGGTGAVDGDPYAWERCRDGNFIGTFISIVLGYSDHWRRKRGIG